MEEVSHGLKDCSFKTRFYQHLRISGKTQPEATDTDVGANVQLSTQMKTFIANRMRMLWAKRKCLGFFEEEKQFL